MDAMNVLPNGRIRTGLSASQARVGHLLRVWMMLRRSPFFLRMLKSKKKEARALRLARMTRAMSKSRKQLARELVMAWDEITEAHRRIDEQRAINRELMEQNRRLTMHLSSMSDEITRMSGEMTTMITHVNEVVGYVHHRLNDIDSRMPRDEPNLFDP
jgi:septal ring factor EnvC (AmiA/AmiB activator)